MTILSPLCNTACSFHAEITPTVLQLEHVVLQIQSATHSHSACKLSAHQSTVSNMYILEEQSIKTQKPTNTFTLVPKCARPNKIRRISTCLYLLISIRDDPEPINPNEHIQGANQQQKNA